MRQQLRYQAALSIRRLDVSLQSPRTKAQRYIGWRFHPSHSQDVDKYEEDSPSDALPVKNFWKLVENSMRLLVFWQVARSGAQLTIGWLKMAMFLVC